MGLHNVTQGEIWNFIVAFMRQKTLEESARRETGINAVFCIHEMLPQFFQENGIEYKKKGVYADEQSQQQDTLIPNFIGIMNLLSSKNIIFFLQNGYSGPELHAKHHTYALTDQGYEWLKQEKEYDYLFHNYSTFAEKVSHMKDLLGERFVQKAVEACNCYQFNQYLASCIMTGTALEELITSLYLCVVDNNKRKKILDDIESCATTPNFIDMLRSTLR